MGMLFALIVFAGVWFGLARHWRKVGQRAPVFSAGLVALLAAAFVAAGSNGAFNRPAAKAEPVAAVPAPTASVKAAPGAVTTSAMPTLGLSLAAYSERFDAMNKTMGTPYHLRPVLTRDASGFDKFSAQVSDRIVVMGALGQHAELRQLMITADGDGTDENSALIVSTVISALAASIPNTTVKDALPTIMSLFRAASAHVDRGEDSFSEQRTLNGVRLTVSLVPKLGQVYTAVPAAD